MAISNKKTFHKWWVFTVFFCSLFFGLLLFSFLLYQEVRKRLNINLYAKAKRVSGIAVQLINSHFSLVMNDIDYLKDQYQNLHTCGLSLGQKKQQMHTTFYTFMKYNPYYDQLRSIGVNGRELLRINQNYGHPAIVPDHRLQQKKHRYYFKEGIKLAQGEYFVSPFDLNIENKKIERPLKPMIRFVAPLYASLHRKLGLIVVNYLGGKLLEAIKKLQEQERNNGLAFKIFLVNSRGYFFLANRPELEWGFMFGKKTTVQNHYPRAWEDIIKQRAGRISCKGGFFNYVTIEPFKKIKAKSVIESGYPWYLLVFLSKSDLAKYFAGSDREYLLLVAGFFICSCVLAFFFTKINQKKWEAERKLERAAYTDPLTGLLNRRAFLEKVGYEERRSERNRSIFSVALADIDHFKKVNDAYGHDAGDLVLQEISAALVRNLRGTDLVCRWGGEEIVVLLPETKKQSALNVCDKLRNVIEKLKIPYLDEELTVTVSIGVAEYSPARGMEATIGEADTKLYQAKEQGRNRVIG